MRSPRLGTWRTVLALAGATSLSLASCVGGEVPTGSLPAGTATSLQTPDVLATTLILASQEAKVVDRRAEAGYSLTVPTSWNHAIQRGGVYFSADPPVSSASLWEGVVEVGSEPPKHVIFEGLIDSGDVLISGTTLTELVDGTNTAYLTHFGSTAEAIEPVILDGEPAVLLEHVGGRPPLLWLDVIAIHQGRAYALVIGGPPQAAAELRSIVKELLASVRWAD